MRDLRSLLFIKFSRWFYLSQLSLFFKTDWGTTTRLVFLMQGFPQPSLVNAQNFTVWSIKYLRSLLTFPVPSLIASLLVLCVSDSPTDFSWMQLALLLLYLLCTFPHVFKVLFLLLQSSTLSKVAPVPLLICASLYLATWVPPFL